MACFLGSGGRSTYPQNMASEAVSVDALLRGNRNYPLPYLAAQLGKEYRHTSFLEVG